MAFEIQRHVHHDATDMFCRIVVDIICHLKMIQSVGDGLFMQNTGGGLRRTFSAKEGGGLLVHKLVADFGGLLVHKNRWWGASSAGMPKFLVETQGNM